MKKKIEKKDILSNLELRSESVQDILSESPKWMIQWGNTIFLAILLVILIISYVIKYPEFIRAPIVITSKNQPEKIISRNQSKIEKVLIKDHQKVKKGDVLIVLQSSADYDDVIKLKNILDSMESSQLLSFPLNKVSKFNLGEIQEEYNDFKETLTYLKSSSRLESTKNEQKEIAVFSQVRFLFEQLKKATKKWEQNYLIISNTTGVINYQQYIGTGQILYEGKSVLAILPKNNDGLVGIMLVPSLNSGKIIPKEKVLIKLNNYQFQEFGIIEGKVENISAIPDDEGNYYVYISLPNGLKTSYNKSLKFDRELRGNAEIVTQDLRLIERIFYQIRRILG